MRVIRSFNTVDLHAEGEAARVILGGVLDVPGETPAEKREYLQANCDWLRLLMVQEPRGRSSGSWCNLVLPSSHPDAVAGFVIMGPASYPLLSGSNTICVAAALVKTGMVPVTGPETTFTLESPLGPVEVTALSRDGQLEQVRFEGVPCFVFELGARVDVPGFGQLDLDVAFGGATCAFVDAGDIDLELAPGNARAIADTGIAILRAAQEQVSVAHPSEPRVDRVDVVVFVAPPRDRTNDVRLVGVVAAGEGVGMVDRSPGGVATGAAVAVRHARGELGLNEELRCESIIGTTFTGRLSVEAAVGGRQAVRVAITGRAWVTGMSTIVVEADDPFPNGFLLGG